MMDLVASCALEKSPPFGRALSYKQRLVAPNIGNPTVVVK